VQDSPAGRVPVDNTAVFSYYNRMRSFAQCVLGLFVLGSCPSLPISQAAESPATFKAGEFTFQRPADWKWVSTASPMRKAQLEIQGADKKETADVIFYHFGEGNGGGTQANVQRWLGQFREPKDQLQAKVEEVTVNSRKVTYVEAQGTYMSGMPGGPTTPQPNSMLLGAILESPQGNVFIRLTGPVSLAKASKQPFRKLVESGLAR